MKKLIKLSILIALLAIFAFSDNLYISKTRRFVSEKGKELFTKGTNEMKISENETIAKIGEIIE